MARRGSNKSLGFSYSRREFETCAFYWMMRVKRSAKGRRELLLQM